MTLVELLVVMVVTFILVAVFLPGFVVDRPVHAYRIQCVNNLKQDGLAFRIWEGDHGDRYPMAVPGTNGGSMDFLTGLSAFRTFQVMSNELSTPKVLLCPKELENVKDRFLATNFINLCNSNISFFVGVDAAETNFTMILSGDHNITNGTPIRNGLLDLTTHARSGWTSEIHNKCGNISLADGSVQMANNTNLQTIIFDTGVATNRLLMPILGP